MVSKPWYCRHHYLNGGQVSIDKVFIHINAGNDDGTLESALGDLTADGPFVVGNVELIASGIRQCTVGIMHPDLVVGFRSVIELQHQIARKYEIVSLYVKPLNQQKKDRPAR